MNRGEGGGSPGGTGGDNARRPSRRRLAAEREGKRLQDGEAHRRGRRQVLRGERAVPQRGADASAPAPPPAPRPAAAAPPPRTRPSREPAPPPAVASAGRAGTRRAACPEPRPPVAPPAEAPVQTPPPPSPAAAPAADTQPAAGEQRCRRPVRAPRKTEIRELVRRYEQALESAQHRGAEAHLALAAGRPGRRPCARSSARAAHRGGDRRTSRSPSPVPPPSVTFIRRYQSDDVDGQRPLTSSRDHDDRASGRQRMADRPRAFRGSSMRQIAFRGRPDSRWPAWPRFSSWRSVPLAGRAAQPRIARRPCRRCSRTSTVRAGWC